MVDPLVGQQLPPEGGREGLEGVAVGPEDVPVSPWTSLQTVSCSTEHCHHMMQRQVLDLYSGTCLIQRQTF